MDYGRGDNRGWTVRRPNQEPDGPLSWILGQAFLLLIGAGIGAVIGYLLPLIIAFAPGASAHKRDMDRGSRRDRSSEMSKRRAERAIRDKALETAKTGTEADARKRAIVGAIVGALAAGGVAFASKKKN